MDPDLLIDEDELDVESEEIPEAFAAMLADEDTPEAPIANGEPSPTIAQ